MVSTEEQLESVSYDDDEEEEDDDILKPVFSQKSSSSPLSKSSSPSPPNTPTTSVAAVTQASIEERARTVAQCNLKYQHSDYAGLSLSDFFWQVGNNSSEEAYPCHVVSPEHIQAYAGTKPRRGQVAIRYIGKRFLRPTKYKASLAIVARKQLVPFHCNESSVNASTVDDDTSMIVAAPVPQWCPQRMQQMRELVLQNRGDDETGTDQQLQDEFLHESVFLDCVLELVVQLQEEQDASMLSVAQQVTMESEEDSSSFCSDEEEEKEPQDQDVSGGQAVLETAPTQEEPHLRAALEARAQQPAYIKPKRMPLRAGDLIMYSPPECTFEASSWRISTIRTVWGSSQCTALYLFDGTYLPRDCRIAVQRRFLRNKLQNATDAERMWRNLTECNLIKGEISDDPANPTGPTLQEKCAQIMESGRQEMLQWNPDEVSSDDSFDDSDDEESLVPKPRFNVSADALSVVEPTTKSLSTPKAVDQRRTVSLGAKTAHKREQKRRQSSKPLTGKRKAFSTSKPLTGKRKAISSPESPQGEPQWKKELETRLEGCAHDRKKRRVDYDGVQVRERGLKLAIRVRMRTDWSDALLEQLADEWDLQASTLQTYLDGNPKNLLFKDTVREINQNFEAYLEGLQEASHDN